MVLWPIENVFWLLPKSHSPPPLRSAMLPSSGLPFDLGHKTYWPVYAEAERLGCALGVHGGAHHSMGLDTFETFVPIHALGHPLSLIIAFTGMVYHGVFNQFPRLRMGFLEGGAGWVTFGWTADRSHLMSSSICAASTKGVDWKS
jgi:predicted TIM-barrel fold metal-dependent hydrolase